MKMFKFRPRRVSSEQEEAARRVFWRVVVNIFIFRNSPKYTQELCRFVFVLFFFLAHSCTHSQRQREKNRRARDASSPARNFRNETATAADREEKEDEAK